MIPLLLNRWVQLLAGSALSLVLGFGLGHHQKTLEDAQAALSAAHATTKTAVAQGQVNSTVDQHFNSAVARTSDHTSTNLQRIPVYVSRKADDQCIIGRGAVQLLDAAGRDSVPGAPVSLPDADSGVALSQLVSDDIANAGSYHTLAERLNAWDEWYDRQAALFTGKPASP